jgi:hypothetical protein|uniref:NADAR domain-containing protein n=1 Tax=viral metagenome TaxID=1070528 RepID=A0A6C0LGB5_9ZZZZ
MSLHNEKFYENEAGVYFKSGYPSQWFISHFVIDDVEYNCCEQYMMAQKAVVFEDFESHFRIMNLAEPKEQKSIGRLVKNFDEDKWNAVADEVVYKANLAKFSQNPELRQKLLETNDKIFVECSPYDKIWGNGLNISETLVTPMNEWKGTNRLGKAIMRVRATLQECN